MSRGTLKRTVPNKRTSDSDEPIPRKTPRAIQEKSKAVYKTALNGEFFLIFKSLKISRYFGKSKKVAR